MTALPLLRDLPNVGPPAVLFERVLGRRYPFLLESALPHESFGRYSFLGCDPFLVLRSRGRCVELDAGGTSERLEADPLAILRDLLDRYALPPGTCPVPLAGGAVGYLGYDLGGVIERLPHKAREDLPLPDMFLCFYDAVAAWDHAAGRAYLVSTGLPEQRAPGRRRRAERRIERLRELLCGAPVSAPCGTPASSRMDGGLTANMARGDYLHAIATARRYIEAGDIYQVNLSQRFTAPWPLHPWELYRRLRSISPAPFAAYLDCGEFSVLSTSPERFLKRTGDTIETRPIKGTRPRGWTPAEDARLAGDLQASFKDRAEHIMIVDLERSDLGRVAEIGSVHVAEMMALESFATVHHLTSTIRARLRPGTDAAELLRATFPGGSVTGAPKIRAIEIIDELEPTRRGVYTGAIGYFSFSGDLDLSIAIRTAVVHGGKAHFQLGGAIVYDSDPEDEYQETLDKGRALFQALEAPGSGPPVGSVD